jgi:hypothetical protein
MAVTQVVELCDHSVVAHSSGTGQQPEGMGWWFICLLSLQQLLVLGMG